MESIGHDESGLPPVHSTKGFAALPRYRGSAGIHLSKAQIVMLAAALLIATGSVVGIVVVGMGLSDASSVPGTQRALTFCERAYAYPAFVDAHGSTGWALLR